MATASGAFFLALGIASLVIAYGPIINGVILYYLYRLHVKAYFGKVASAPASDAAAA